MSIFPSIPPKLSSFITCQLYLALPPPPDDTPDTIEARDLTAMAAVVRLGPANTAEALLAVQAVAAQQHAIDALQSVAHYHSDFKKVGQCRAQSALMIRQAATALRELRALQETRLTLLAEQEAEQDAKTDMPRDDAEAEVIHASPGLSSFADAWRNQVVARRSQGVGLRFTSRYTETETANPALIAPFPVRMTAGYHPSYPG
jgi:hypothetical protein